MEAREYKRYVNPLKTELNPICHLLALLGAQHTFHISRIRVNSGSQHTIVTNKRNKIFFFFYLGSANLQSTPYVEQ